MKNKTNLRIISIALAAIISLLSLSGCTGKPGKIVEDYPTPVKEEEGMQNQTETGENTDNTANKKEMSDEEFEELIKNRDPFESGKFIYDPLKLDASLCQLYRDNPNIIKLTKAYMNAAYNMDTEFSVPEDEVPEGEDLWTAIELASILNPLCEAAGFDNTEESNRFKITYFPRYIIKDSGGYDINIVMDTESTKDPDEAKELYNEFVDYVSDLVNNNVSEEDSDIEKARAVYKALVSDIKAPEDISIEARALKEDDEEWVMDTLVEGIHNRELDQYQFATMYRFVLMQLDIECIALNSGGIYVKQDNERLDKYMGQFGGWNTWNIVVADGFAYHCDLFFEVLVLEAKRETKPDYEPEMIYFGMSDETRDKSFKVSRSEMWPMDTREDYKIPNCEKDYEE